MKLLGNVCAERTKIHYQNTTLYYYQNFINSVIASPTKTNLWTVSLGSVPCLTSEYVQYDLYGVVNLLIHRLAFYTTSCSGTVHNEHCYVIIISGRVLHNFTQPLTEIHGYDMYKTK